MRKYRKRNKSRLAAANNKRQKRLAVEIRLQRKGLDPVKYAPIVRKHRGRCDICGKKPDGRWRQLNIDHCHRTGRFRGMLCFACNRALGYFRDSAPVMRRALAYLVKPESDKESKP